jgi:hypothetical protein
MIWLVEGLIVQFKEHLAGDGRVTATGDSVVSADYQVSVEGPKMPNLATLWEKPRG